MRPHCEKTFIFIVFRFSCFSIMILSLCSSINAIEIWIPCCFSLSCCCYFLLFLCNASSAICNLTRLMGFSHFFLSEWIWCTGVLHLIQMKWKLQSQNSQAEWHLLVVFSVVTRSVPSLSVCFHVRSHFYCMWYIDDHCSCWSVLLHQRQ